MARAGDSSSDGGSRRAGRTRTQARTKNPDSPTVATPTVTGDEPAGNGAGSGLPASKAGGAAASGAVAGAVAEAGGPVGAGAGGPAGERAAAGGPGRLQSIRHRILPRSVLGISSLILAFAIGAGFSGVVLYSYYQYKQNQADNKVNALISGYKHQFAKAQADLNAAVAAARANINEQVQAAQQAEGTPSQLAALIHQVSPSMFYVHTLDANGQASVGTAFVISSNSTQSLLLTSYTTVAAATHSPAPVVYVRQGGGSDATVTVSTWDPGYDLALLILPQGNLPALTAAPTSPAPRPGDRLFAVSGLSSAGASIDTGTVVDVSSGGLAMDAAIGPAFQGAPLVNQSGQVVAVGSRTYSPLGFPSNGVWYAPYVEAACSKVLSCPGGTLVGAH